MKKEQWLRFSGAIRNYVVQHSVQIKYGWAAKRCQVTRGREWLSVSRRHLRARM